MGQRRRVYERFYDTIHSRWYDVVLRWFLLPFGGEASFRRRMTGTIDFAGARRILDLCCGTGSSTLAIRDRVGDGPTIVGVDLSIGQLAIARKKRRLDAVPLVKSDGTDLPFRDRLFDAVVIPHALHEMPHETRIGVLREARRVMTAGGQVAALELDDPPRLGHRLLLGLWLGYWLPYPLNFENPTRRDMLRRGLANEFREAGFGNVSKTAELAGTMQVVIGRARAT